jgi:hypothetical protein
MCKQLLLVCLILTCTSGCAVNGAAIDTSCDWVRPILVSRDDALSDDTARQVLMHNEQWELLCAGR